MKNNLRIIASLAKITEKENKNSNLKIIASILQYPYEININEIKIIIEKLNKNTNFFFNSKFIVIHLCSWDDNLEGNLLLNLNNFKYIKFNIFRFIKIFLNNENNKNINELFMFKHLIEKCITNKIEFKNINDLNVLNFFLKDNMNNYNIIFIFEGLIWSNILFLFNLLGITIYGGSNTRRHLLSTVQLSLVKFLELITNFNIDPKIIYNSFNNLSDLNSKYDKNLINIINNCLLNNTKVIETFKFSENYEFYLKLNLLLKIILELLNSIKNLEILINNNLELNNNILNDKKQIEKYTNSNYSHKFSSKKIRNATKRIINYNEQIYNNKNDIIEIEKNIKNNIILIYIIENKNNFFDNKGIFNYDNRIKINLDIINKLIIKNYTIIDIIKGNINFDYIFNHKLFYSFVNINF